jgi:hypothetical protein
MPDVIVDKPVTLDLLEQKKPALHATSDAPVIETKPDVEVKKAAPVEGKKEDVTATPETESASADVEARKPAKGVQKRLDELTRNWREEQRGRQKSEELLAKALTLLEKGPAKAEPSGDDPEPEEPDVSKYTDQAQYNTDYRTYLRNVARWEGRQEFKSLQKRDTEERQKRTREEQGLKLAESYQTHVSKARSKYPDYDDVVGNDALPISRPMADAIMEAGEQGPELAYHLGQNPDEALRISQLSPRAQFLELGRLAAKLSQAPATTPVSKASPPIKPLSTGVTASRSSEEESMEAYAAKRMKQLQEERRPGRR